VEIYLGHNGVQCPALGGEPEDLSDGTDTEEDWEDIADAVWNDPPRSSRKSTGLITVVDRSGVHPIRIGWCKCSGAPPIDIQFLRSGMFPASFKTVKTAFTFAVLDDLLIDNLECKTSAMSFFSKLRRVTNNAFPQAVPVRHSLVHINA
jgi:hypothetical protein